VDTSPLISIAIPTLKRPLFAKQALESALQQTGVRCEVLVSINDYTGSDESIIENWKHDKRLKVLRHEGRLLPMAENWNTCVYEATGEFFLLLSDDDLLHTEAVATLLTAIRTAENSGCGTCAFAWCPVQMIDDHGRMLWATHSHRGVEKSGVFIKNFFRGRRGLMMSSILHRRKDLLDYGGFNGSRYGVLCDVGYWARAAARYDNVVAVEVPLVQYRLTVTSTTCHQSCEEWVSRANVLIEDIAAEFNAMGKGAEAAAVRSARKVCIANHVITILMQRLGKPGWAAEWYNTLWKYRSYFLCYDVINRFARDGSKVFRLFRNRLMAAEPSRQSVDSR
jgi:glycosyltransferase involved in cell wall biosynthesis